MRNLKLALTLLFVLLVAAVVLFFVLENQQSVSLVLFGWSTPVFPVALPILGALLVGMALGPVLGFYVLQRGKKRIRASASNAVREIK